MPAGSCEWAQADMHNGAPTGQETDLGGLLHASHDWKAQVKPALGFS